MTIPHTNGAPGLGSLPGVPEFDATAVLWEGKHGTVEASDLRDKAGQSFHMARVWSDACDVGCRLTVPGTRRHVLLTLERQEASADGTEIVAWRLRGYEGPESESEITLTVFND